MNDNYLSKQDFCDIPVIEINPLSTDTCPLVSVLMIAWNHELYVAQAIESIVAQQCDFSFEVIIGEDCSQDGTRAVCERYQRQYPELIRLIVADENVGMHRNLARLWHRARGKYIAICEGDDYWTDPKKLAKQAAWLESRPAYTLCGAYTRKIARDVRGAWVDIGMIGPAAIQERYTVEDLIPAYSFHTSSVMVRRDSVRFPRWFWEIYCADRPLYLLCAEQGPAGFIPEVMSVYRTHEGGIWSPVRQIDKARKGIELFQTLNRHFEYRYDALIQRTLGDIIWSYMAEALDRGDRAAAQRLFWLSMRYQTPKAAISRAWYWIVVLLRLYAPRGYQRMKKVKDAVFVRNQVLP